MSQRLKLLKRLQDVNLSPEEAEVLLERVQNHDASAKDRDRLAQVIRTTTQVSAELLRASAWREEGVLQRPSPARRIQVGAHTRRRAAPRWRRRTGARGGQSPGGAGGRVARS
jgi:hypothetical protein